ncbi:MAG: hypothetical protein VB121_11345 [Enterococcus thailandicus]|nr:hypothetical protein [Enterococcus thailandicus]
MIENACYCCVHGGCCPDYDDLGMNLACFDEMDVTEDDFFDSDAFDICIERIRES